MRLDDFDYSLPEELIAQMPLAKRDDSRLLVVDRKSGTIKHSEFKKIAEYFSTGDLLVLNESRVVPARLLGQRPSGGKVEVFVLKSLGNSEFECLVKSSAAKANLEFTVEGVLHGKVLEQLPGSISYRVRFEELQDSNFIEVLERVGRIPLPPYIHRNADASDKERYQTVYAKNPGSVAAPTAGLHYTDAVFASLREKGVVTGHVDLQVGLGTFQPIKSESIEAHQMHTERFYVPESVRNAVRETKAKRKRVIAAGTTSVRALESCARQKENETDLYLYPGEKFLWVDSVQTNFHQPKSSLLVLMAAFMGRELLMEAYQAAIKEKYRFFSYGDSMLVL